jgi:hypothetical protein
MGFCNLRTELRKDPFNWNFVQREDYVAKGVVAEIVTFDAVENDRDIAIHLFPRRVPSTEFDLASLTAHLVRDQIVIVK